MWSARMPTSPTAVRVESSCSSPEKTVALRGQDLGLELLLAGHELGLDRLGLGLLAVLRLGGLALDALVLSPFSSVPVTWSIEPFM